MKIKEEFKNKITWFEDSPDTGPDCICSLCGKPILENEMPIRMWNKKGKLVKEARFHKKCFRRVAGWEKSDQQ